LHPNSREYKIETQKQLAKEPDELNVLANYEMADIGSRIGAVFIDAFCIMIILAITITPIALIISQTASTGNIEEMTDETGAVLGIALVLAYVFGPTIAVWIYQSVFDGSRWQGTPGKRLLGFRVIKYNGENVSFKRAMFRNFMRAIPGLLLIGFVMALIDGRRQTLHDMVAKTFVVKRKRFFDSNQDL